MINIDFFKREGYLHLQDFIQSKTIKKVHFDCKYIFFLQFLKKQLTSVLDMNDLSEEEYNECLYSLFQLDIQTFSNCGKQIQHLISLHKLSLDDKIVELLKMVGLKNPNIATRPVVFFNHPKLAKKKIYNSVDAHQDWRSMQGSLNSVVLWLPLVNIDKALGPLEIYPTSHLKGLLTDHIDSGFGMVDLSQNEISKLIPIEVNIGDALLFSSFLVHQSGNNISNKPRWSCHFRYNDLSEDTFIDRGYAHPYIYRPSEELITPNFPSLNDLENLFS